MNMFKPGRIEPSAEIKHGEMTAVHVGGRVRGVTSGRIDI
jgi:predicted PhzF superfamily epimerase YddE/YHI9